MTEFKTIDTKDLQIKSLVEFAKALGYVPVDSERLNKGFVIEKFSTLFTNYIGFKDMCKLHNGIVVRQIQLNNGKTIFDWLECSHIKVSMDKYISCRKVKLVEQVKLQPVKTYTEYLTYYKHESGVFVQNHMVRLTEKGKELYEHLRSL